VSEQDELAKVRAERAALSEARAQREEARSIAEQLENETRALRDEQAIAKAEEEIGPQGKRIMCIQTDMGVVIVKKPHAVSFRKFQDKGETDHEDLLKLVSPCLVYPSKEQFAVLLDDLPATLQRCANAVATLAGVRVKEVTGKS
jgi:hypothetical protein